MEQFGIINFYTFLVAGILLNLTPGSDTMYILARSVSQGRKAGILSALGISTGAVFHTVCAACGLSVILMSSATAFYCIKLLGGLYLIYLGITALIETSKGEKMKGESTEGEKTAREIYLSGVITNVLNPKVALFFLAFLPQFIDPNTRNSVLSFLILGATFITTGTIWCICLALFSSLLTRKMKGGSMGSTLLKRCSGCVFLFLGVKLALSER